MKIFDQELWQKAIKEDRNAEILDVRSDDEFEEGHIPGARLVNVQEPQLFMDHINQMDKDKSYYIYCNSGNRGIQACMVMDFNGFSHTYNLDGGFENWTGKTE